MLNIKIKFLLPLIFLSACGWYKSSQKEPSVLTESSMPIVFDGTLHVIPGNTISISIGKNPSESRTLVFNIAKKIVEKHGAQLGFDPRYHKLVIPKTPYKPGTTEHWPDKGAHITVALHGQTMNSKQKKDAILPAMAGREGSTFKVSLDEQFPLLLLARPQNDEAVGAVYYLALNLDNNTIQSIQDLRMKMGLGTLEKAFIPHITLAGIAPVDGDFKKFRSQWCEPFPEKGMPSPLKKLTFKSTKP